MTGRLVAAALMLGASCDSAARDAGVANPHPVHLARPASAPLSAMALLGRQIYFDTALSSSGRQSCASCHRPDHAYAAADRVASVPHGDIPRAVPSLRYADRTPVFGVGPALSDVDDSVTPRATSAHRIKVADGPRPDAMVARGGLFWDGRANTLQDQAMGPLFNPNEMGNRDASSVRDRLHQASYASQFVTLFGADIFTQPDRLVDEAMFAVARYQIEDPSFHPYDSKYDAYLEGRATLTATEWRGLQAFEDPKRGNCAACHLDRARGDGLPPVFTDYEYAALGVPADTTRKTAAPDLGACGPLRTDLKAQPEYCGKFRTPSLRNTATRTAFFHNGVFSTLDDVVAFYNFRDTKPEAVYHGAVLTDRRNLDTVDAPFNRKRGEQSPMTDQEMRDVVAFLRTLTDGYVAPRP